MGARRGCFNRTPAYIPARPIGVNFRCLCGNGRYRGEVGRVGMLLCELLL